MKQKRGRGPSADSSVSGSLGCCKECPNINIHASRAGTSTHVSSLGTPPPFLSSYQPLLREPPVSVSTRSSDYRRRGLRASDSIRYNFDTSASLPGPSLILKLPVPSTSTALPGRFPFSFPNQCSYLRVRLKTHLISSLACTLDSVRFGLTPSFKAGSLAPVLSDVTQHFRPPGTISNSGTPAASPELSNLYFLKEHRGLCAETFATLSTLQTNGARRPFGLVMSFAAPTPGLRTHV